VGLADGLKVYDVLACGRVPSKIQTLVSDARDKGTIKVMIPERLFSLNDLFVFEVVV
jgi:hypothetical protein